jgi:hypothetical protein
VSYCGEKGINREYSYNGYGLLSEINFEQQFTVYCVRDVLSGRYEFLSAIGRGDEVRNVIG